jgi:hypothetical protein
MYWLYGSIAFVEDEAPANKLVNEAADEYFVGNAQLLRRLEAVEKSLANNAKIVIPSGAGLVKLLAQSTLSRGLS